MWLQGSLFVLPTAAILFSGGLEGPARQGWDLHHRVLPRLVLSKAYDGRPKAERLLSPQRLFDLFPPQANPLNPSIRGRTETSRGQGRFILVYRLAMDARPWKDDGVAG